MIIGANNNSGDLNVNSCENKKLSNTCSSGADETIEITPESILLRKNILLIKIQKYLLKLVIINKRPPIGDLNYYLPAFLSKNS